MIIKIGENYTTAQRALNQLPRCPNCGTNAKVAVTWRDATVGESMDRVSTPISFHCRACSDSGRFA